MKNIHENTILTIVICTYNRAYILKDCLDALLNQTIHYSTYSIIVVDNNSTDDTAQLTHAYTLRYTNITYVKEVQQGLGTARNTGIAHAQTKWIACVDDDAKAHSNWVATLLTTIRNDDFDCVGGPYLPWYRTLPPPWFVDAWESSTHVQNEYGLMQPDTYPIGANCAFARTFFNIAGGFPSDRGMNGNQCGYGEETTLFHKMREHNARVGWVPSLLVDHCVLPHKYKITWRVKSAFLAGRELPSSVGRQFSIYALCGRIYRILVHIFLKTPILLWRSTRSEKFYWQRFFVEAVCPLAQETGYLAGYLQLLVKK